MEKILMALFGGGTADWQDISKTNYDWQEIFEKARYIYGFDITINDLYYIILSMALEELNDLIENYVEKANTKEELAIAKIIEKINIESDFDIWTNCLDTHISFIGDENVANTLVTVFAEEIDEIDDKIGFTYINFNN